MAKSIITINSDELIFDFNKNDKLSELHNEEQSLIIHKDFNFDGDKDLAIMDGQFSCYHRPSFQIYLETNNGLKHSPDFSLLAQDYCGMFKIDNDKKTIHTVTKSGCCLHQYTTFKIVNNIPVEEKILEFGLNPNGVLLDYSERNGISNRMVEKKYSVLSEETDIIRIHSVTLKNGKQL